MDSTLILDYAERLAREDRRLTPSDPAEHARAQRLIGLALAACEKTVQIVYERNTRPAEKQHEPWLERVRGQMFAAYGLLEDAIGDPDAWLIGDRPMQADVTAAVAWRFTHFAQPDLNWPRPHPKLAALSARAEGLPEFVSTPLG
jgi:glutathione S-transferase